MEMTWNVFRFDRALADDEQRKLIKWCAKQSVHSEVDYYFNGDTQFTVGWIPADTCDELEMSTYVDNIYRLLAWVVRKLPDVTFRWEADWGFGPTERTYHGADPLGMEIADLYEQIGDLQGRVQVLRTTQANRNAAKGA